MGGVETFAMITFMPTNLEKFTSRCNQVLENSKARAFKLRKKQIEAEDIFWALTQARGSLALEILNKAGFRTRKIELSPTGSLIKNDNQLAFSTQSKRVIEKSVAMAAEMDHIYVGTEHLLHALLDIKDKQINKILLDNKIDKKKTLEQLKIVFQATLNFGQMAEMVNQMGDLVAMADGDDELLREAVKARELTSPQKMVKQEDKKKRVITKREKPKLSLLNHFAYNLTDEKNQQGIDPVIGRQKEIERIIQILSRRTKNNPVLLGDPGVGKTAIVEGLAKKIVQGDVPDILLNKKIYSLDINMLVAGAMMRGEFEARLKQVIDEVKNNPEIILFIDELHNIIGAGSVMGTMDAANILKPALARGDLRCIGATTYKEYKKHIEEDPALERRFQPVQVAEPSIEETIQILQGIKDNYEKHHLVKITDEAIEAAANLSQRYLPEKFLPDKAIDLIDETASRIKINSGIVDEDLRQLKLLEDKIESLDLVKSEQVKNEDYPQALKIKQEQNNIYEQILGLEDKLAIKEDKWLGKVKARDVAQLISSMTGVPLTNLVGLYKNKILNLEKLLSKRIIGQSEILKELAFYLKRSQAGLSGSDRPLGSFMFFGPSGIGKTETAKVLSEEVFANASKKGSLIRFDMSEFAESFNISRMIGSPAGYVGYKEGGRLTEAVRRNPYSIILFDEIEKAHPEVFNILLQILDDGILTDATGKQVNFKNTIIILTSNLGSENVNSLNMGFGGQGQRAFQNDIVQKAKEKFRPEFLNRLDKILVFKSLDMKSIEKIVELQLKELAKSLANKKIKLSCTKNLVINLAKLSYSPESGARNVRKTIEDKIENELANYILNGKIKAGNEVGLGWRNNKIVISN